MFNYFSLLLTIFEIPTYLTKSYETGDCLFSLTIFLSFLRLVSFFRLSSQYRKLIRILVEIMRDMRSFVLVLGFGIIGLSLIFKTLEPNSTFES